MNPDFQRYLTSILRHALTGLGGWLTANGYLSADDSTQFIAGIVTFLVGSLWSLWVQRDRLSELFTALAMVKGSTLRDVQEVRAKGKSAPASTRATSVPRLASPKPRKVRQ